MVFDKYQHGYEYIKNRQDDKPDRMSVSETIDLIGNKQKQYTNGNRVRPKLPAKQTDNQKDFHHTVDEKIPSGEKLAWNREVRQEMADAIGDEISRVFAEFLTGKENYNTAQGACHKK